MGKGRYLTISEENYSNAHYIGNVIANAQAIVAKAAHQDMFADARLDVSRNSIGEATIEWIEAEPHSDMSKLSYLLSRTDGKICNGDVMFHIAKGTIAFKLDNVSGLHMSNSGVETVENRGPIGSLNCFYSEYVKMPGAFYPGYNGADARGFSIAGSEKVNLYNVYAKEVCSYAGSAWGIDVHTDSKEVDIRNAYIHFVHGGANEDAQSYNDEMGKENPNRLPFAAGLSIREETEGVCYGNLHIEEIFSINGNYQALNDRQHDDYDSGDQQ